MTRLSIQFGLAPWLNSRYGDNQHVLIARPLSKWPRNLERAAAKFQSGHVPRIQTDGRLITDHANRFQLQRIVIRKDKMEFYGFTGSTFQSEDQIFPIIIEKL